MLPMLLFAYNICYVETSIIKFKRAFFSTRPSEHDQIWHACADRDETGSHLKKMDPPQVFFRGLSMNDVVMWVCLCQLRFTYLFRGPVTLYT